MTYAFHLFSSVSKNDITNSIHTIVGSLMPLIYKGSNSFSNLSLTETYLIPKLRINLIYVGQLCNLGYQLTFSSSGCRV